MEKTIVYNGIELIVEGTYTEGDKGVMYYGDSSGQPPTPSEFYIESVYVQDTDITELLWQAQLDEISNLVIEDIEN